ncbi:MAG TPA: STAS domain-containing protein [Gemmataceae bacterium]|nr:STAS domain-containing protein [Gemmataceae bacterium]
MALCPWSRFLKVAVLGDVAVVELSDALLRESYAPWLFGLAREMPGRQIHLDCDEVEHFSSAALATLIALQKVVKESGGRLRLFNLGPAQYDVLAATRLTRVLDAQVRKSD